MSNLKKQIEQKIDMINHVLKKAHILEQGVMMIAQQAEMAKAKLDELESKIESLSKKVEK